MGEIALTVLNYDIALTLVEQVNTKTGLMVACHWYLLEREKRNSKEAEGHYRNEDRKEGSMRTT